MSSVDVIGVDEVGVKVLGRTVGLAVDIDFEDNSLEYKVVWKCNSDRTEVSVVGRRRCEERRFDMERKWNIVNCMRVKSLLEVNEVAYLQ